MNDNSKAVSICVLAWLLGFWSAWEPAQKRMHKAVDAWYAAHKQEFLPTCSDNPDCVKWMKEPPQMVTVTSGFMVHTIHGTTVIIPMGTVDGLGAHVQGPNTICRWITRDGINYETTCTKQR